MASTRRLAAIMFTDLVGFTAATQENEAQALDLLREQEALIRSTLPEHHGREIKSTGDGFLIEFESALQAAECAIDVQQRVGRRNSRVRAPPMRIRIGLHLGDVEVRGSDIVGDAVNIAARIRPLAPGGGICVSQAIYDQIRSRLAVRFEKLGVESLKNVRSPVEVYGVEVPDVSPHPGPERLGGIRLAVLPLANISPDPQDAYFADGLTEELIGALSKISGLRLIARTWTGRPPDPTKPLAQIAAELDASALLSGSVRKSGNRLRISLRLIDVASQENSWTTSLDRELDDVFAVQTEVAEKTAAALQLQLLGPAREALRRTPTSNLEAYKHYLRGVHAARQSTSKGFRQSLVEFEAAIKDDPTFAPACAQAANVYLLLAADELPPREAFPRARQLVTKALELDPSSSDAHTARGNLALQVEQDWTLAESEFRRAIALNPSNANAHFWYAMELRGLKRFQESVDELQTTIELEPLWWLPREWMIWVYLSANDFEAARAAAEEEWGRFPADHLHLALAAIHFRAGRLEEARKEAELAPEPVRAWNRWARATLWARLDRPEAAQRLLEEWKGKIGQYVPPIYLGGLYAALGDKDRAIEWLERDYSDGDHALWSDYQWLAFDLIRDDPRFSSLLERLHLPAHEDPN